MCSVRRKSTQKCIDMQMWMEGNCKENCSSSIESVKYREMMHA